MIASVQLVTLPYNLLLQKNAREALEIDLRDQIVVIDEAHSRCKQGEKMLTMVDLIDTILSIHSTTIKSNHIKNASLQLQQYLTRFRNRLKPIHALWIRQTLTVLRGLNDVCEQVRSSKGKAEMLDANDLMQRVGGGSDQVNLTELVRYFKDSKLARKVSGFAEKTAETPNAGKGPDGSLLQKCAENGI